ncbi:DUF4156 domain-containing protein [Salmonella enterica subsp. enterica]|nr:DUF4156 domain-containing protein [Salmonella enterica subsp. enterica]
MSRGSQNFLPRLDSISNLETGARNDLKTKFIKWAGNTVVLLTPAQARQEVHGTVLAQANKPMSPLSGNVYRCPR